MDPVIAVLAAAAGYLLGSISFARVMIRMFAPDEGVRPIEVEVPDSEIAFRSGAVSATTVNLQLGPRHGCMTGILDIFKIAAPAFVLKHWQTDAPYYLILAAMGTLGHNWPLYYGFQGGRGMSTIVGGMLVVDWVGMTITTGVSIGVGALRRSYYLANRLSILLMIPWLWIRHRDWQFVAYAVAVNVMNWIAVIPEAREMLRLRRDGRLQGFLEAKRVRVAGRGSEQTEERLTFYGTLASLFSVTTTEEGDTVGPTDSSAEQH